MCGCPHPRSLVVPLCFNRSSCALSYRRTKASYVSWGMNIPPNEGRKKMREMPIIINMCVHEGTMSPNAALKCSRCNALERKKKRKRLEKKVLTEVGAQIFIICASTFSSTIFLCLRFGNVHGTSQITCCNVR
jgi:hypothetical protein